MKFYRKTSAMAAALALCILVTGCQTTSPGHDQRASKIDSVMEKAAHDARTQGNVQQSLSILENMYKRQSNDPNAAAKYAKALREEGYFNRASIILSPFVNDTKTEDINILTEYSSINAAMGNYVVAEESARRAVLAAPESGKAYHVLGVALDAQGHHEQANVAFDKALDYWEGDPSPVLNNIGLNLAAQGFLDEAVETLRKAMDTAPNRMEIERNLRIVSALQYQPPRAGTRLIPKPPRKPEETTKKVEAVPFTQEEVVEVEVEEVEASSVIEVEKEAIEDDQ